MPDTTARRNLWRWILMISTVVTLVCGAATFLLREIPFGTIFETFLTITVLGLVCLLLSSAVLGMRSNAVFLKLLGVVSVLLAILVAAMAAMVLIDYRQIPGMAYEEGLTAEQWIEDLRFLAEEFPEIHPRLYEMVPKETFENRVKLLEGRIPGLDANSIKAEFYKLVALPNCAHTFPNVFTHKLDWHILPLQVWMFDEGMYVLDTGREDRSLIGCRITAIEDVPVEELYERMRPYFSAENRYNWRHRFGLVVLIAEILRAEGIVEKAGKVDMTFESRDGETFTRKVRPVHYMPVMYWSNMRPIDNRLPYILGNDRRDAYWFEYREETGTLYIQFNNCYRVSAAETVEQFLERLGAWVDDNDFDRTVIDIRKNDGGDTYVSVSIADFVKKNDKIDREGRLFVLTSRKTYSAAVMFLSMMESNTTAVSVGEPTGQSPYFCGVPRHIALPNSGIEFNIAQVYNRSALEDDGLGFMAPELPVDYTLDDYLAGRDPMIEAVLAYRSPAPAEAEPDSRIAGKYMYSPYQVLMIEPEGNVLKMEVTAFLDGDMRDVRTVLRPAGPGRFDTGLEGVDLILPAVESGTVPGVTLDWRGRARYAERLPDDHRLPLELLAEGQVDVGVNALMEQKEAYIAEVPGLERLINAMGYELLRQEEIDKATAVFSMNVQLFPESANTYDSLGEACMKAGDREGAIENYEKALELMPGSANAEAMLERLRRSP